MLTLAQVHDVRKPKRAREPKRRHERRFAEDCQYGDVVEWAVAPQVKVSGFERLAPAREGVVSMFLGQSAFVRFAGGEPLHVLPGQPVEVKEGR